MELGELEPAARALDAAVERASRFEDPGLTTAAVLTRLSVGYATDPQRVEARVVEEAERAISEFGASDRHDLLARAWRLLLRVHFAADAFGAAEEAIERMIEHAEAEGDLRRVRRGLGGLAICALYGPRPVAEAVARCEEVLLRVADDRKTTAVVECSLARLEAMQGSFDRARALYRQSRRTLREFGWALLAAMTSIDSGPIEMLAGDFEAAERELRADYDSLRRMGEQNYVSTVAGLLATALYELGRVDEADELAAVAAELGAPDDTTTQVVSRCVRAKILAGQGRFAEAETVACEAVELTDRTDYLEAQANARVDLATVYELAGDTEAADRALEAAAVRYERKGNVVAARAARARHRVRGAQLPLGG
jgi:ATP/maltotriose-dependent transcriptional regulator MalT